MSLKPISICAVAIVGLLFSVACGSASDPAKEGSSGDVAQTVQIAGAHGRALDVAVLSSETSAAGSSVEVRLGGRLFELSQWTDAASGSMHNVVTSVDGAVRYEAIIGASEAHLTLSDAAGERTVRAGESMGKVDADAAALLLNFHAPTLGAETAYYQTYCVGYDTSDPSDWHLTVGSCTCAHWYSIICTMN